MDFWVQALGDLVGHENGAPSQASVPETKPKVPGSGLVKQERSGSGKELWRSPKMPRSDDFSVPKTMPLNQSSPLLRSNSLLSSDSRSQEHMLSFSQPKSEAPILSKDVGLVERGSQNMGFYYYQQNPSAYSRSAGYGSGSLNANMHGAFGGVRGPFTPSQWIELEHQALIYKYITANVPVPSNLLIPLKKSLYPYGFTCPTAGSFPSNSLGWNSFHLGFSSNTDPEPGRCRRTDGKKWRCSRDAVPDQKYCERHINRGRHRSRKPVEGQTGHAATAATTNPKVVPMTSNMSTSVITGSSASNSLTITPHQIKTLQPGATNPSAEAIVNRVHDTRGLSMLSSSINLKANESAFSVPKQDILFDESSISEFGLVSSDSLLNPSQKSPFINSKNYSSFLDYNDQETKDQHPLRQFIDDWPKDQSNRPVIAWPEELKSDWTQLSMSIPMASSDFSSSSSSPTHEKHALSPLRLSHGLDSVQMGLGVNSEFSEPNQKQLNWIPISWGNSMGGPLGEVLTINTNNVGACKKPSALNLLNKGSDGSPQLGSSPTGVLQKATFGSLSNSSSGSSPVADNKKTHDLVSLCDDVHGSTLVSSSSVPSL